jgi:hypothetical protein
VGEGRPEPIDLVVDVRAAVEPFDQQLVRPAADDLGELRDERGQRRDAFTGIAIQNLEAAAVIVVGLLDRAQLEVADVAARGERREALDRAQRVVERDDGVDEIEKYADAVGAEVADDALVLVDGEVRVIL